MRYILILSMLLLSAETAWGQSRMVPEEEAEAREAPGEREEMPVIMQNGALPRSLSRAPRIPLDAPRVRVDDRPHLLPYGPPRAGEGPSQSWAQRQPSNGTCVGCGGPTNSLTLGESGADGRLQRSVSVPECAGGCRDPWDRLPRSMEHDPLVVAGRAWLAGQSPRPSLRPAVAPPTRVVEGPELQDARPPGYTGPTEIRNGVVQPSRTRVPAKAEDPSCCAFHRNQMSERRTWREGNTGTPFPNPRTDAEIMAKPHGHAVITGGQRPGDASQEDYISTEPCAMCGRSPCLTPGACSMLP